MDKTFDVEKFIARIGERSVVQFDDAKAATSPSAVGDAMESPVRDQLQQILPRGIDVGSGFVIHSYGATSPTDGCGVVREGYLSSVLHQ